MRGMTGCLGESVGLSFCVHHSYPEGMPEILLNAARRKSRRMQPA
jgi:hypothetical protein